MKNNISCHDICPVNFKDAWAHLGSFKCLSLETRRSTEEAIEPFVSGSRLWCRERASLIMHQWGKSIRDHIHLMHEADIYALKNTCLLTLNPWPGKVGLSSFRVAVARGLDGLGWGWRYPTLRHHFCPVPDKTLKHAWDVYSTMANSTYLTHPEHASPCLLSHFLDLLWRKQRGEWEVISEGAPADQDLAFLSFCCVSDLWKYHRLNL